MPSMRRPKKQLLLSVVVPVYNEEEVIPLTHERIVDVLCGGSELDLEVVYVDDGSHDRTPVLLGNIAAWYPGETLEWDARGMKVEDRKEAGQHLRRKYREGWPTKGL